VSNENVGLLTYRLILDIDTTVKPLYGHQEGAVVSYNPNKPGRPSHSYHTCSMSGARVVIDVDVNAGNEHTSKHFAPGLWALLDRIPRHAWPAMLRDDAGFGVEAIMREAEARGLPYLFKLRLTASVKRAIERLSRQRAWTNAGQGFEAKESMVRLEGWSQQRRAIVLRRRLKETFAAAKDKVESQPMLTFVEISDDTEVYEYCVLVTMWTRSFRHSAAYITTARMQRSTSHGDSQDSVGGVDRLDDAWRQATPWYRGCPNRLQGRNHGVVDVDQGGAPTTGHLAAA
jgi:hypothetical protein